MSILRRIELNHAHPAKSISWEGVTLLLTGAIATAALMLAAQQIDARISVLETDADHLQHPYTSSGLKTQAKGSSAKNEEIKAVQAGMAELSLPWEPLFKALENSNTQKVKLLAMEPDARQHRLRVTAEAAEPQDMLDYVQTLSQQPMLKDVFLLSNERDSGGEKPSIRFVVTAEWVMNP